MTKAIDLFVVHEYAVTLSHTDPGDLGLGTLIFGANKWARVVLRHPTKALGLADGTTWPIVRAKTECGPLFTLFDCVIRGHSFYADYVILGDVGLSDLKKISIRYTDISEWLANWQILQGELGEKIIWVNGPKPLSVIVPSEQMTISTEIVRSLDRKGEDHVLHEHIEFVLEKNSGAFTIGGIQRATLELSCLLSILLAHPIFLVGVVAAANDARAHQVYFPGFKKSEKTLSDDGYMTRCFIQARDIEDRWGTIFERYYSSSFRQLIWVRLSGMQRYDSFWEYKAMGYVGLLDQYVTQATKGKTMAAPLSAKRIAKLNGAIDKVSPPVSTTQKEALIELINTSLQSKRELYFTEKVSDVLNGGDVDITKIINLNADAFTYIKEVRDAVAHGDDPNIRGKDFTRLSGIITKLELLLTYWAFIDFGLTKGDFLKCLTSTHNHMRFAAQVNDVHLDRVTKSAEFFSMAKAQFEELSLINNIRFGACFLLAENGEVKYSEHYTKMQGDWLRDSPSHKPGIYSHADIFGVLEDAVRYVGKGYVEFEDESLQISPMYLFDPTKLQPN